MNIQEVPRASMNPVYVSKPTDYGHIREVHDSINRAIQVINLNFEYINEELEKIRSERNQ